MSRLRAEQQFHDRQARDRGLGRAPAADLRFEDEVYLQHESWIAPAVALLGEVRGLRVLDHGCGHGMASVLLARRGARVTGLDLSLGYLAEARARAAANGVAVAFVQGDGERLPFADASFERVWGSAVLHHLDVDLAGRELYRVLAPHGHAVFCEPWGENPLLNWVRRSVPYPGKDRTVDEAPLRLRHVRQLQRIFHTVEVSGFQLLGMVRRALGPGMFVRALGWCDGHLLRWAPGLQRYCRYAVLTLRKAPAEGIRGAACGKVPFPPFRPPW